MKAATCARNSRISQTMKFMEKKIVDVLDRRKKSGQDNEDYNKNMSVTANGERVWSF
ncbi:MAG: hypothetical protein ACTSX1_11405 [Candidatus Heimdallarchaeaceae archaeon]